jgi:hypothetical protein
MKALKNKDYFGMLAIRNFASKRQQSISVFHLNRLAQERNLSHPFHD